jgi:hypothetical protein
MRRMQRFFDSLDSLQEFTSSLDYQELMCTSCSARRQFVSHGFVYKQRSSLLRDTVGKRIFCSNRSGRTGCGRTVQLYLATEIPSLHYGASQLFIFITALLANLSITAAYHKAVNALDARHAWRWFKKCFQQLIQYRRYLHRDNLQDFLLDPSQSRSRQLLLPTLHALFSLTKTSLLSHSNSIAHFQHQHQIAFF